MSTSQIKNLISAPIDANEERSEKLLLSDKQINSTLENDSFFDDEDLIVDDECIKKHSICTSTFNSSSKLINEKGKFKELYGGVNPLCPESKEIKTPPKALLNNSEPLIAFRRKNLYERSDCDSEQSQADFSDIYSLSNSSDGESLSLGTFRSQLISEN
uniref:Uncharacterized protein n=1 Tax=Euplotes crassus TaxID=5936 RepID=A0A7S3KLD5_EUPCR|mmetsp:Transcript_30662/g.30174  ORF Transcript_30662/g.30174 Transcript_30662/m.30174 type:complete len:159 (+) Transcript_30662:25-501(+)|eukprot:CAMPEP_0196994412 /NCGR_PEP_ID=MMETSP1380-20130617/713_1 /TAXON_ID=5936 /ORGANISM="Euplotes crassus, Strain CT5" /LENGTH=158 /DNA_ID=CAMNT_0042409771 /DNA_START=23 /DNA_END=499 /DNA_ORIENTATION=+